MEARSFDYVVVGGGSSGCIVAARLAARGSVLLLEAGDRAEDNPETLRADGYKEAFINDRLMFDRFTVPQPGCGGRRLFAGTGRGIGGSGSINAMVYTRGAREDLDAWGEGWRWDDVRSDFEELEAELRVRRRTATVFTRAAIRGAAEQGMREKEDLNDGDLRSVLGHEWMNFEGDDRRNSYASFIRGKSLPNLTIETGALGRRIVFDHERRARAVEYVKDGVLCTASASREIVACSGALATPELLLRSGIGPAHELSSLGVDVVVDAPGVGKNLHDHPNVTLFFLGHGPVDCSHPQLYGFDRMRPGEGPSDCCFVFYPARSSFREGLMRMLPAMTLSERLYKGTRAVPLMRGAIATMFRPALVRGFVERVWGIVVILGKPESRGALGLARRDGELEVRIDPAYLTEPSDLEAMVAGVRHARRIAASTSLREIGSRELIPGPLGGGRSDDRPAIERFLRQNLMTTYHFAGTCRLGDDGRSVVDRRLRVRGVRGLRVADASAIPETPVAALNAPSMLIGLRASKMIVADAG